MFEMDLCNGNENDRNGLGCGLETLNRSDEKIKKNNEVIFNDDYNMMKSNIIVNINDENEY